MMPQPMQYRGSLMGAWNISTCSRIWLCQRLHVPGNMVVDTDE